MGDRFLLEPPIEPMLARPIAGLPDSADGLAFEPKWDGFRCLVYRRDDDVAIQGRMRAADAAATGSWDLTYAFPEMVEAIRSMQARDVVLDGELVVVQGGRLAFDALGMRLRPRKEAGGWKIAQLAHDLPTSFVVFDVLAAAGADLRALPSEQRREQLEAVIGAEPAPIHLTPRTRDLERARTWFAQLPGAGLDGLIARPQGQPYTPGRRTLFKVKPHHSVDVVCAGWRRYARTGPEGQDVVGSLLIGLYDELGVLQMIGAISAFPMAERVRLADVVAQLPAGPEHPWLAPRGRAPGAPSRWQATRSTDWTPIRPELVAEVSYDQLESGRLRHLASLVRWRPDKDPAQCTTDQLVIPEPLDIADFLARNAPGRTAPTE